MKAPMTQRAQAVPKGSAKVNTVRVFQDGDFVFTHTDYNVFGPKIGFDIFRFEDGKIVEHWDNLQETAKSSKDYRWFFDVYLYRAALPRLVAIHEGSTLKLRWQAPDDLPFPMPVDVRVNDRIVTLPMLDGTGMTPADATATITIDPLSKILMQSDAIDLRLREATNSPSRAGWCSSSLRIRIRKRAPSHLD